MDLDRTIMVLDHLAGDVETKAGSAFTFGGEKRLKNVRDIPRSDSRSGVGYRDAHLVCFGTPNDGKNALFLIRHRVGSILQKVDYGLNHLPSVEQNEWQFRFKVNANIDVLGSEI